MSKTPHNKSSLRQLALEKENLRLQRKIAQLEAKLVSARNELLLRPPYAAREDIPNVEELTAKLESLF